MIKTLFEQFIASETAFYVDSCHLLNVTEYTVIDKNMNTVMFAYVKTTFPYTFKTAIELIHTDMLELVGIRLEPLGQ